MKSLKALGKIVVIPTVILTMVAASAVIGVGFEEFDTNAGKTDIPFSKGKTDVIF